MKLLVFGSLQDPHVSSVLKCLSQEFQVDSTLIDFGAQSRTGLVLSESDGVEITFPGQSEDRYSAIWNRIKLKLPIGGSGQKYRAEYVTRRQQFAFFRSVCDLLAVRVVNHPTSHRESKLHDLNVARQVGFRVPHTIIPASKQQIMDEMQTGRSFIMKSLADPNTPLGDAEGGTRVIMTARVTPQELVEIEDERSTVCPHLFQEEIAKDLEIRVIATRSRYFAFSTDAHKDELTSVDWRYGNFFLNFSEFKLDDVTVGSIAAFLDVAGLAYGVFDLILDPDGTIWFLECNREGQWYWLERDNKVRISRAIAEALASIVTQQ